MTVVQNEGMECVTAANVLQVSEMARSSHWHTISMRTSVGRSKMFMLTCIGVNETKQMRSTIGFIQLAKEL